MQHIKLLAMDLAWWDIIYIYSFIYIIGNCFKPWKRYSYFFFPAIPISHPFKDISATRLYIYIYIYIWKKTVCKIRLAYLTMLLHQNEKGFSSTNKSLQCKGEKHDNHFILFFFILLYKSKFLYKTSLKYF